MCEKTTYDIFLSCKILLQNLGQHFVLEWPLPCRKKKYDIILNFAPRRRVLTYRYNIVENITLHGSMYQIIFFVKMCKFVKKGTLTNIIH